MGRFLVLERTVSIFFYFVFECVQFKSDVNFYIKEEFIKHDPNKIVQICNSQKNLKSQTSQFHDFYEIVLNKLQVKWNKNIEISHIYLRL